MKLLILVTGIALLSFSLSVQAQTYELDFQKRVTQITNRLADTAAIKNLSGYFGQEFTGSGSLPDPEKHVWSVALARLKKYGNSDSSANRLIEKYKDRSPFHFLYTGMARIISQYPQAQNMMAFKETYLQNVWNRTDSYNPWTGEGTENHINMNKTSGYLYAQHSLGNPAFPQAASRLAETKLWLKWYAKKLYTVGNSEWNSSTYQSYNSVGWLNLYDFAIDLEVKNIARAVLDYYACETALHCSQGLTGGPESRGNVIGWGSGEDYFSWVWFGYQGRLMGTNFWINKEFSQSMHAALSSYRPPMLAVKLAKKEIAFPAFFKGSKPDYGQNIASLVKQTLFVNQNFTLGAGMIPFNGFASGNTQYCNWKLVGNINPAASLNPQVLLGGSRFFNDKDGRGKAPWDQYVQHENVILQLHKIPSNASQIINSDTLAYTTPGTGWKDKWETDFDIRFPSDVRSNPVNFRRGSISRNISYISFPKTTPSGGNMISTFRNGIFFILLEKCYVAIRSISANQATAPADESTNRSFVSDNAPQGSLCGLITEVVPNTAFVSFIAFQDSVIAKTNLDKSQVMSNKITYKNLKGDLLEANFTEDGPAPIEPIYDWGFGPTSPQLYQTTPPFLQPVWNSGQGRGRIPGLLVNGTDAGYNNINWAVYDGPGFSLKDSTLLLTTDSSGLTVFYQVDFTGNLPVFSSGILTQTKDIFGVEAKALDLFPNPPSHEVTAKARGISEGEIVQVSIFTLSGSTVWSGTDLSYPESGLKIPTSRFGFGVYQVVLKARNQIYTGRLVLNK